MIQSSSSSPLNYLGRGQTTKTKSQQFLISWVSESHIIKKKKTNQQQNPTNTNLKFVSANTEYGTRSPWSQAAASTFCLGLLYLGNEDDNLSVRKKDVFKMLGD